MRLTWQRGRKVYYGDLVLDWWQSGSDSYYRLWHVKTHDYILCFIVHSNV